MDALSIIVHKDFAYGRGKAITEKLRTLIPRQQFEVPIQAAIGNKILSQNLSHKVFPLQRWQMKTTRSLDNC